MLAIAALGVLSLVGGWIVVQGGGFHHAPSRLSPGSTFVDGVPAVLMAVLQFLLAAIAFTAVLRRWLASGLAAWLAFGLVFLPPLVWIGR